MKHNLKQETISELYKKLTAPGIVLDVETTFQVEVDGKKKRRNPSPFHPENRLVSIGYDILDAKECKEQYFFLEGNTPKFFQFCDLVLNAKVLVAHNAKFDIEWLLECGATIPYDTLIVDTMLIAYVLMKGRKNSLTLENLAQHYQLTNQKAGDLVDEYMKDNISFENIPREIVEEYGLQDVRTTKELYNRLMAILWEPANQCLIPTVYMMSLFLRELVEMERAGIPISHETLEAFEKEYTTRYTEIVLEIEKLVAHFMGDTKINLDSPEQLSWLIYSRRVVDKAEWRDTFNIGTEERNSVRKPKRRSWMRAKKFTEIVRSQTSVLKKTQANHCRECRGKGKIRKIRVDGTPWKNESKCPHCNGEGFTYTELDAIAGLKCIPLSHKDASDGGFATDSDTLRKLSESAKGKRLQLLELLIERNHISTYLSTYIGGIRKGLRLDNTYIRTQFMQAVAATGRLSSRDPNFQNQPRGSTFPIRKVVVSRWSGGKILSVDLAQLEFRAAAILANCPIAKRDIANGVDVHSVTRDVINAYDVTLNQINRQDAKPHTFKPLYGGMSGTPREIEYYQFFNRKYKGIAKWHEQILQEALNTRELVLPTGRIYAFPTISRSPTSGYISNQTQVKNYPVQGFATADIVPWLCVLIGEKLRQRELNSCIILTVHDDVNVDTYPGEEESVIQIMKEAILDLPSILYNIYNIILDIPLEGEIKIGDNWLEQEAVAVVKTEVGDV